MTTPPARRGRRDNGLDSEEFAPVADVDPRLADHLLDVLGLRDVPAYVEPAPAYSPVTADRLYVAADRTDEARQVLTELASELGIEVARNGHQDPAVDPLAGIDTEAEFAAIVAGLEDSELGRPLFDPSTSPSAQVSSAADDVTGTDDVEHYVPPPPPPLPRPALATAMAAFVTLLGIAVIAFGAAVGLPTDLPLPLGVVLVLFGVAMLILRLRPEPRDDSDDDGAVV